VGYCSEYPFLASFLRTGLSLMGFRLSRVYGLMAVALFVLFPFTVKLLTTTITRI